MSSLPTSLASEICKAQGRKAVSSSSQAEELRGGRSGPSSSTTTFPTSKRAYPALRLPLLRNQLAPLAVLGLPSRRELPAASRCFRRRRVPRLHPNPRALRPRRLLFPLSSIIRILCCAARLLVRRSSSASASGGAVNDFDSAHRSAGRRGWAGEVDGKTFLVRGKDVDPVGAVGRRSAGWGVAGGGWVARVVVVGGHRLAGRAAMRWDLW